MTFNGERFSFQDFGWLIIKRVDIPFLDMVEESMECYALIEKATRRVDARMGGMM